MPTSLPRFPPELTGFWPTRWESSLSIRWPSASFRTDCTYHGEISVHNDGGAVFEVRFHAGGENGIGT